MGALLRAIDWSKTAVGPVEQWPQSLRTALSILLETGFPMYIAWGPQFTQFYNDGYRPILGSTKHPRAMGISTQETFAEIWSIIGPMFEKVMHGTSVSLTDFELPLERHGFPEECYFIFSYSPIRREAGDVGGVLVTVTETTERVIGARRLVTLRDLAARTQNAPSAQVACEVAADVIAENPADVPFALLYLIDPEGNTSLAAAARIPTRLPGPLAIASKEGGSPWPLATICATKGGLVVDCPAGIASEAAGGGSTAPARAFALPIFAPGGDKPSGVLVAALSPRLLFDAKYRSFLELVAGHVGSAIASARALQEAKAHAAALTEIDRAKTAFFSNVSHEFRTPLTLILGPSEDALTSGDALPAHDRARWTVVHRSAMRLSKLVNTLLDFSRIEAGRVEASYEPTDLGALTGELVSMFRSAIDRAGLRLRLELPARGETAYVDRDMWEKIVLNLLSNALKFTFEGEISVKLRAIDKDLELAVEDTGIGIARSELPRIFERFHRVKGARTRTHEGTGIGLALVAELAKLHGGHASVDSVEGRGTTFTVRIPRGRAHLPADRIGAARTLDSTSLGAAPYLEEALHWLPEPIAVPPVLPGGSLAARGVRDRIVLADDNADMRDYLGRLLGERWDVETVSDGEAALATIRRRPPDLVLTDVMMPGLDGFGLLRAVRGDPALRLTPVILLSARAGEEATAEGLGAGANDYVVKPFSARDLLMRVASKLAVAKVAREAYAIEEASRTRLYRHFMQAPFPVSVLRGPSHVFELANPAALRAWGKDDSIIGKTLVEGMPELRGQPFLGYLDEVYRSGVAYKARGEFARLARVEGGVLEDVYFDLVYAPLRESDDAVSGILVCGFEVTSQVRVAQELSRLLADAEANERQFRELVENLPDLAWTARADGYVDYYNHRWYEYTGTTHEQVSGWGWKSVHDPQMVDQVVERWKHSLATGEPFEMEYPLRGADGQYRWFLTRVRPFRDAEGRVARWFGSNTNIDERRRNEDFKETFLGVLGHDLRNPLNTILTTARVLCMRGKVDPDAVKRLERVIVSGVRMQRMIEQLLDVTRARLAGGIPVELSADALPLAPLVTKIVDEIRAVHPSAKIELLMDGGCVAHVDPDRFEQVVSNLVDNAVTHGDVTRPILIVMACRAGEVTLAIQNHGAPIPRDAIPLLFNPFARVEKPAGRSAGLGLGLYISERIIDAHGGTLSVDSSAETGTKFTIALPAK